MNAANITATAEHCLHYLELLAAAVQEWAAARGEEVQVLLVWDCPKNRHKRGEIRNTRGGNSWRQNQRYF